jgi:hypothetical protein
MVVPDDDVSEDQLSRFSVWRRRFMPLARSSLLHESAAAAAVQGCVPIACPWHNSFMYSWGGVRRSSLRLEVSRPQYLKDPVFDR